MPETASVARRFDIALSFPGEHRGFVEAVAGHLAAAFGRERVLYDKYYEAEFAQLNLDVNLPSLYRTQSELIVLFLYPDYKDKRWCRLELRAIRQLIETTEAKRIMLFRHGYDVDFSDLGIYDGDGRVNLEGRTPDDIAALIVRRFHLNRGTTPSKPPDPARTIPVDIGRIDKYAPEQLIGREAETAVLDDAWAKVQTGAAGRPHVLTFVGLGGEGKTSVVAKWAAGLAARDWPGCSAAFAWSFYDQGMGEGAADSSDLFLAEALKFFGDPAMAASAQSAYEKGKWLAQLAGAAPALLILDGVEPLQYPPTSPLAGKFKDAGLEGLLKTLAASSRGLGVITTRASIEDLRAYRQKTAPEIMLERLSKSSGAHLLRNLGVKGPQAAVEMLVEAVKGHALTLILFGGFLRDAYAGDVRQRDRVRLQDADEELGGHAFRVMDAYICWFEGEGPKERRALAMLRLLGLFDRPADASCLEALWRPPAIPNLTELLVSIGAAERNLALAALEKAKLVSVNRDGAGALRSVDSHPLLRDYFAKSVRIKYEAAWRAGHLRLYEHLRATTKHKLLPTLEDLQPLYQAVTHGCLAGKQQEACDEVYYDRILRGREAYSIHKLGAYGAEIGAIACFFEQPWSRVSPALMQSQHSWVLSLAAFRLRAIGRLTEAVEPERVALAMFVTRKDWFNSARGAGNLSELELALGDLDSAVSDADRAVVYADRCGDAFEQLVVRATSANVLHQAGNSVGAAALFREAEAMQAERQPAYAHLYSLGGFQYCDLLLAEAEIAAWRSRMDLPDRSRHASLSESCWVVAERGALTLQWAKSEDFILDIALNHFTLGRAALYGAMLDGGSRHPLKSCSASLQAATEGLRRAGNHDYIVLGLLSRAWLRCVSGAQTGDDTAQEDLDEAFEIAERGPMPLFLADIHLHRARLFGLSRQQPAHYPWDSPQADLAEARRLIEKHGYGRRRQELEDAETAARRQGIIPG
jgi:tetratricopeptide (TPR) repeat protein